MSQVDRRLRLMQAQRLLRCRILWIPQRQAAYDLYYQRPSSSRLREAIDRFDSVCDGIWEIRESAILALMREVTPAPAGATIDLLDLSAFAIQSRPPEGRRPPPIIPLSITNIRHSPRRPAAPPV